MSFAIWAKRKLQPKESSSAEQPADYWDANSVGQPAGDLTRKAGSSTNQKQMRKAATPVCAATSFCAFARLPFEIWRQLVRFLSYSDVAACACSTNNKDTKRLLSILTCVSTFKRLLVEYGAITWDVTYGEPNQTNHHWSMEPSHCRWDEEFWNDAKERKHFWMRAIEIIFLYEPQFLLAGQRCDTLIQQDYIHSCGVLFASKARDFTHRKLQRQFRVRYGAPHHIAQPWFADSGYPQPWLPYSQPESDHQHFLNLEDEDWRWYSLIIPDRMWIVLS